MKRYAVLFYMDILQFFKETDISKLGFWTDNYMVFFSKECEIENITKYQRSFKYIVCSFLYEYVNIFLKTSNNFTFISIREINWSVKKSKCRGFSFEYQRKLITEFLRSFANLFPIDWLEFLNLEADKIEQPNYCRILFVINIIFAWNLWVV